MQQAQVLLAATVCTGAAIPIGIIGKRSSLGHRTACKKSQGFGHWSLKIMLPVTLEQTF